jgi:hypothetical protein
MKKVILCALVLAVNGVLVNSVLAQEVDRYLVTYVRSQSNTPIRSATAVTVVNQSSTTCRVRVEWFLDSNPTIPVCNRFRDVPAGGTFQFCSRNLSTSITNCDPICTPPLTSSPTGNEGKAIVSSSNNFECSLLGVEARVYYTTGAGVLDTAISAISNSKIVRVDDGNFGD